MRDNNATYIRKIPRYVLLYSVPKKPIFIFEKFLSCIFFVCGFSQTTPNLFSFVKFSKQNTVSV